MAAKPNRAISDRSDGTQPAEALSSPSALPSQRDGTPDTPSPIDDATLPAEAYVEPHSATRTKVRVGRDGTATVGGKTLQFGRALAGALLTLEVP